MRIFTTGSLIQWICLIVFGNAEPWTVYKREDLDVTEFTGCCGETQGCQANGQNYYRYLEPSISDSNKLYVGAMNYLFALNTDDMSCMNHWYQAPTTTAKDRCTRQAKTEIPDCQNHIREVFEINNELEVCGTGAYAPGMFYLNINDLRPNRSSEESNTVPTCPYDPMDNNTLLYSRSGNPGNASAKYFGYYTDFTKNFPVFLRPRYTHNGVLHVEKLTDTDDQGWLNAPQFVGSFDIDNMVVTFFRENALEYPETNDKVYSRVAKVCKNDRGGGQLGAQTQRKKWLSFQKARLICSLPGSQPYYFDDIYDVAYDAVKKNFYALFYKQGANLNASAICVYNMTDVMEAFNGDFMFKNGTKVDPSPNPRLDNCTLHDTNPDVYRDTMFSFNQLMYKKVQPVSGRPIFYKHGEQMLRLALSPNVGSFLNIYVGTSEGKVYDLFVNQHDWTSVVNSIKMPFNTSRPIWKLMRKNDSLIAASDFGIAKIPLDDCRRICNKSTADECILNTYCKLKVCDRSCIKASENVDEETINATSIPIGTSIREYLNSTLNLKVNETSLDGFLNMFIQLDVNFPIRLGRVHWKKQEQILSNPIKYGFSQYHLIIKDVTLDDEGLYIATDEYGHEVTRINLKVATTDDEVIKAWKLSFASWSTEFNRWKSSSRVFYESCQLNIP